MVLLDVVRDQLVAHYKDYKAMASQDRSFFNPDLHRKFADLVEEAIKELRNDQTGLWLNGLISILSLWRRRCLFTPSLCFELTTC
jgi:hypothetical protein